MARPTYGRFDVTRGELWADGTVQVLGVILGAAAVAALFVLIPDDTTAAELISLSIYSLTLMGVLIVSAVYNLWPISRMKWLLRRFDHSAIYLLIAGTYTPLLMKLGESDLAWILLAVVWSAAFLGVLLKVAFPARFDRLSIALYLLIGWCGIALWETVTLLPGATLWLIGAGGLLYTIGVLFHVWQSLPFQNAIWHAFVLVASGCFYGAIANAYTAAPAA
jgi:hemolysin III